MNATFVADVAVYRKIHISIDRHIFQSIAEKWNSTNEFDGTPCGAPCVNNTYLDIESSKFSFTNMYKRTQCQEIFQK